ncbi:MAG: 30S ribosomal protein S15 [Planctomycetota bacterium]|nr:30S ribosomal protein S15 [Planctomycetota bacterium]
MAILAEARQTIIKGARRHEKDTGSPEVQISMLTARIREISEHCKTHDHDFHSRRGLVMLVGKRNRLLRYLAKTDAKAYQDLITKLGLRK